MPKLKQHSGTLSVVSLKIMLYPKRQHAKSNKNGYIPIGSNQLPRVYKPKKKGVGGVGKNKSAKTLKATKGK